MTELQIRIDGPSPNAPVVVLVNGLGATSDMWVGQVDTLSAYLRVVRYEQRVQAASNSTSGRHTLDELGADLLTVLDRVEAETASIVGLSLGGTVGLWLAIHHPDRLDRMVVGSCSAYWNPEELGGISAETTGGAGMEGMLDSIDGSWFTAGFLKDNPPVRDLVRGMLRVHTRRGYQASCDLLLDADMSLRLAEVRAATLVIAGADDRVAPIGAAAHLAGAIPGASLLAISPGAHYVNLEQPDRFNAAVLDHLVGSPSSRGREIRRQILGDPQGTATAVPTGSLDAAFGDLVVRYAWGEIWTRPGLDRRSRSYITIAMLIALGRQDELELHLRAAKHGGVSENEIREILLQSAIYCGAPAAHSALTVARRVFEG